ncbi:MAG: disulfide bond formation protein B [Actinomycetales bacterium]|nr:disulfide bond formation protein B [Actinomycetales bacterium]
MSKSSETLSSRSAWLSPEKQLFYARLINLGALLGLLVVLAGSLHLQFGVGEQPCPLCLVQRSGMIGLSIGPIMNLLWGIRARHYALSILAAFIGGMGSVRQILLHIEYGDPGYGPVYLGFHLYTWALITSVIGAIGCALLLMWETPLRMDDRGVLGHRGWLRAATLFVVIWVTVDLVIIAVSVLPECGLGMCPDDPADIAGLGDMVGWLVLLGIAALSAVIGVVLDRRLPEKPAEA